MKLTKNDYLISSFFMSGFIVFSSMLYLDYNKNISASGLKPLGKVVYKKHEVKRKYSDRLVWEEIETSENVYSYDSILTGENSDAKLKLENGLELELKANSMVELNFSENQTKIKIKNGNIKAKSSGEAITTLETQSGVKIEMSNAEAAIASGDDEMDSSIQVKNGSVSLLTKDNKKIDLKEGELAKISGEKLEKETITISLQSPPDSFSLYTDSIRPSIDFSWKSDSENNTGFFIELSSSASFSNSIIRKKTDKSSLSIPVPAGTWYWRVRSTNGKFASGYRQISVVKEGHPLIYFPDNNRIIEQSSNTAISFRWENKKIFNLYEVKIDDNADFSSPIVSETTSNNSWRYNLSKPGVYYFTVLSKPESSLSIIKARPNVSRFTVSETKILKTPMAYTSAQTPFTLSEVKNSKAILKWENTSSVRYHVSIYDPNDSNRILYKKSSNSPYLVLPDSLKPGLYRWILSADYGKQKKKNTDSLYFKIKKDAPILLLTPAQHYQIASTAGHNNINLNFQWQNESGSQYYTVFYAKDKFFKKIILKESITTSRYLLRRMEPGKYFWKVKAYSESDILNQSPVRSFVILPALPEIKNVYPLPEQKKIEIAQKDYLAFKWDKVDGATHYEFKLYQNQNGKNVLIKNALIQTNYYYFYELTRLKESKIYWQVTPIVKKDKKIFSKGKTRESDFNVKYGKLPDPPKIEINTLQ